MVEAARSKNFTDADSGSVPKEIPSTTEPTLPKAAEPALAAKVEEPAHLDSDAYSYSLEEDGFVGARDLAAKLDADAALKAAIPADLRNEIMANARLAETGAAYREIFASPEEAKIVAQTAQEHAGFIEAFNMIATDTGKGTNEVIRKLIEAGAQRDAEGNIIRKENGQPVTNGIAGKFFDQIFRNALTSKVIAKVEALGDENVTAALDLVMESVGLRPSTAAKTEDQDPALTARAAALDAQEARIAQTQTEAAKRIQTEHTNLLKTEIASASEGEVKGLLALATGLSDFEKQAVERELWTAIAKDRKTNTAYNMRKNQIDAMPYGPERRKAEVALVRSYLQQNLARVAKPIFLEAGVTATGKASERAAAQAARAESARSEVTGGRATSASQGIGATGEQRTAQAIEAFKQANGGRAPSESEMTIAMMLAAATAKGFGAAA